MYKKFNLSLVAIFAFIKCFSQGTPNYFFYNGAADVNFRFLDRGSGGRALVHDNGNILAFNYEGDFTGGIKFANAFHFNNAGKLTVTGKLNTNDYTIGQYNGQFRIVNGLGQ